ncbi:hypothetical protein [Glycomyces sp. NPDC047010]|uniref:hypothetical protein n=1 Tax=Glycomyces sp. NPDC047010 TaxID=3155023 RepID=UPI0033F39D0E
MDSQDSLVSALGPSIIAAIALACVAAITYLLTTRLEHRKWLRQERLRAYTAYLSVLRTLRHASLRGEALSRELTGEFADRVDQVRLVGTVQAVEIIESHGRRMKEEHPDAIGLQQFAKELLGQAREDLKANHRAWKL